MSHKKHKTVKKKPTVHTNYSLAVGCYCKECPVLGFTCNWCYEIICKAKNNLVRENNELRKPIIQ